MLSQSCNPCAVASCCVNLHACACACARAYVLESIAIRTVLRRTPIILKNHPFLILYFGCVPCFFIDVGHTLATAAAAAAAAAALLLLLLLQHLLVTLSTVRVYSCTDPFVTRPGCQNRNVRQCGCKADGSGAEVGRDVDAAAK